MQEQLIWILNGFALSPFPKSHEGLTQKDALAPACDCPHPTHEQILMPSALPYPSPFPRLLSWVRLSFSLCWSFVKALNLLT